MQQKMVSEYYGVVGYCGIQTSRRIHLKEIIFASDLLCGLVHRTFVSVIIYAWPSTLGALVVGAS